MEEEVIVPAEEVAAEEPVPEAPKPISQRAAILIDFIERARWNIEVCKANDVHMNVRLGYLKVHGEAESATDEDKQKLGDALEEIKKNSKDLAEQERFLAYCNEALEKQKALDEAAS